MAAAEGRTATTTRATAAACVAGVALAGPEWVPPAWSREDGPVEWLGFGAFVVGAVLAFSAASHLRPSWSRAAAAAALGLVLLFAAGEEISWGQRLFDLETPEALVDGNRQDELNLHNIDGIQDQAILAQLAVAGAGALLPWKVTSRWAWAGFPLFVGYLSFRASRGVVALAGGPRSGDNSEVAELLLALGLLSLALALHRDLAGHVGRHASMRWRTRVPTVRGAARAFGAHAPGDPPA